MKCPPSNEDDPKAVKSFTSQKLDWLHGINIDPRVKPYVAKFALTLSFIFNAKTGNAFLSDEVAEDESNMSRRQVQRARTMLKELFWIDAKRTDRGTVYRMRLDNLNRTQDLRLQRREARNERRKERRDAIRIAPSAAQLSGSIAPPKAH